MDSARNISKTVLPDLSRTIARPRLIRQIGNAGTPRVILITGQAAQGKSILAAEMIRRHGHLAAWMHLDAADSDPVNFFHLLAHALKATSPSLDISGFLKHPAIALGSRSVSDRIAEQVGEVNLKNDLVYILAGGELPTQFLEKTGIRITKKFGEAVLKHK